MGRFLNLHACSVYHYSVILIEVHARLPESSEDANSLGMLVPQVSIKPNPPPPLLTWRESVHLYISYTK